jgi:hypothetical protein
MRYAVIEALQIEPGPERFVIAYRTEQSLREFIAAPRIIAFGFSSRAEAIATLDDDLPVAGGKKQNSRRSRADSFTLVNASQMLPAASAL